jgi:hypothetical protein
MDVSEEHVASISPARYRHAAVASTGWLLRNLSRISKDYAALYRIPEDKSSSTEISVENM